MEKGTPTVKTMMELVKSLIKCSGQRHASKLLQYNVFQKGKTTPTPSCMHIPQRKKGYMKCM